MINKLLIIFIFILPLFSCNIIYKSSVENKYLNKFQDSSKETLNDEDIVLLVNTDDDLSFLNKILKLLEVKKIRSSYILESYDNNGDLDLILDRIFYSEINNNELGKVINIFIQLNINSSYEYLLKLSDIQYYGYLLYIKKYKDFIPEKSLDEFLRTLPSLQDSYLSRYKRYNFYNSEIKYKVLYKIINELNEDNYIDMLTQLVNKEELDYAIKNAESYYLLLKLLND